MSIWQKAYETYENHAHLAGVAREGDRQPLVPVGHIVQKAQIEVTLLYDGRFVSAEEVPQEECRTIVPASLESAGRTSGVCAHPLSDQIQYITPLDEKKYRAYLDELSGWAESLYSHPKVEAIYTYIKSETLLKDLERHQLLVLGADQKPKAGKIQGTEINKCLVRWRVIGDENDTGECWLDQSLFTAYQGYYMAKLKLDGKNQLCMITGQSETIAVSHPKGTVAAAYGAKLISANDSSGFTYRGRFTDEAQAATISYEASQKAHSALQWVAANQGRIQGGRTFICWNPKGKKVYQVFDPFMTETPEVVRPSDYLDLLQRTLEGYSNELPNEEDVIIASFDAATTGRLSVSYYNELKASDYYARVASWYRTCCFPRRSYAGNAPEIQSPLLYWVVCSAFGTERNERMEVDERILRQYIQQLLSCLLDRAAIPYSIVQALRNRASQPQSYNDKNREQVLFSACSVIRKFYNDREGREVWIMTLDTKNTDRSYLFGRLLAVMEAAERSTYDRDEAREPNAIRMQSVYCERPFHTANLIVQSLNPYIQRMNPGFRKYYRDLIGSIFALLPETDMKQLNTRLDDTYLLGYFLQRNELYTKKRTEEEEQ